MVIMLVQPLIFIVGMIKPRYIIPIEKIKRKRLFISGVTLCLFLVCAAIVGNTLPDIPQGDTQTILETDIDQEPENEFVSLDSTIEVTQQEDTIIDITHLVDSIFAYSYKETFDSLYDKLMEIDQLDSKYYSRSSVHEKIQNFLYDNWWNLMERIDSTREMLPLTRQEYARSCKKYDKQYARFIVYGDEDIDEVENYAEYEAQRVLRNTLVDPKSLVIERVSCHGKTNRGWKCTVIYRARNGFGGYVREYITLIMAYNEKKKLYECIGIM